MIIVRSPRAQKMLVLLSMVPLSSSCVSPPDPLEVGVKEIATDIVLARADDERVAGDSTISKLRIGLPPTFSIPPVALGTGREPKPLAGPGDGKSPVACPRANPLDAAASAATSRPKGPPVEATYRYRVDGSYEYSGAVEEAGRYPQMSTRKIEDVGEVEGGYTFKMGADEGVTTVYSIYPRQRAAEEDPLHLEQTSNPVEAGIFVNEISMERADGSSVVIRPQPELRIATLPMVRGQKFESTGVDPVTGITIRINGQIGVGKSFDPLKARIDACGTMLEGYWVSYTVDTTVPETSTSRLFGTDIDLELAGTRVAFGTQYGGIPLQEIVTIRGSDAGTTVEIERTSTIMTEPLSRS